MERVMTTVTAICFLLISGTGAWKINTVSDPMEALLGEDVTLPCLLSDITSPLNLSIVEVYWTRKSQDGTTNKVYHFEGNNHAQIRPRSNMNESDIRLGNASLYLPDLRISDEGQYTCQVIVSPDSGNTSYTLLVSGKPQVTLTDSVSVSIGNEKSVACILSQFYPKELKIQWIKHSNLTGTNSSLDGDTATPTGNIDGTFSVSSILTVRPSSTEETGDEYFCIVTHRSVKSNIERSFTLNVTESDQSSLDRTKLIVTISLAIVAILLAVAIECVQCNTESNRPTTKIAIYVLSTLFLITLIALTILWWSVIKTFGVSPLQRAMIFFSMLILVALVILFWLGCKRDSECVKRKSKDNDTDPIVTKNSDLNLLNRSSQDPPSYSSMSGNFGYNQ